MTAPTDTHVARIQALLAKAESTSFPEEAEACMAKAQELMARHSIDQALVVGTGPAPAVGDAMVTIPAPYASAKASLLGAVARANRCRAVVANGPSGTKYCTLVGFPADLEATQTLFSSLSIQAVRFMLREPVPPFDGVRRFRHAFLLAYAHRIGQRLRMAERAALLEAERAAYAAGDMSGTSSVGVVLADRSKQVDAELERRFPNLRARSTSISSGAGYASGRNAADRASLGGRSVSGGNRALGAG
ncbi:MAG: DUF2786 domain-containing protein [Acidimicrobiales bacterium]